MELDFARTAVIGNKRAIMEVSGSETTADEIFAREEVQELRGLTIGRILPLGMEMTKN